MSTASEIASTPTHRTYEDGDYIVREWDNGYGVMRIRSHKSMIRTPARKRAATRKRTSEAVERLERIAAKQARTIARLKKKLESPNGSKKKGRAG